MPRDLRPAKLAAVKRARATVARCDKAASEARAAYRRALLDAKAQGVTNADLARQVGTSDSRIRQEISRGKATA
jgi:DNA-directed RNA polymerase specialized sigma24 family protein